MRPRECNHHEIYRQSFWEIETYISVGHVENHQSKTSVSAYLFKYFRGFVFVFIFNSVLILRCKHHVWNENRNHEDIGFDIYNDDECISITMYDFNEDADNEFARQVIAILARKLKKTKE